MKFPKVALVFPAAVLGLLGLLGYAVANHSYPTNNIYELTPNHSVVVPQNMRFQLGEKPLTVLQKKARGMKVSMLDTLTDLLGPADADATSFNGSVTATVTPGLNVNLQLASPQSSAAYVACNFAIAPICRVYVNAAISTFAVYNGVDGQDYTVEFVQDGTGHAIAVPTAGGSPLPIASQVTGWAAGTAPINAAVAAPTQQPGAVITWKMIYDSTLGSFIIYQVN